MLAILAPILAKFSALKSLFSVDTVGMACRQSKNRDCRDTVDDRVSTTALVTDVHNGFAEAMALITAQIYNLQSQGSAIVS